MKKGRHRRFEEARALKRNQDVDFDALLDSLGSDDPWSPEKPEHEAWSDLAEGEDDDEAEAESA